MVKSYVNSQLELHPSTEPTDILKMCYQACFGPLHIASGSAETVRTRFFEEFDPLEPSDGLLFEEISEKYVRVNMAVWKYRKYDPEILYEIFLKTCEKSQKTAENVEKEVYFTETARKYLDELISSGHKNTADRFAEILPLYLKEGVRPVSHSENYRLAENPHYRVVSSGLLKVCKKFFA